MMIEEEYQEARIRQAVELFLGIVLNCVVEGKEFGDVDKIRSDETRHYINGNLLVRREIQREENPMPCVLRRYKSMPTFPNIYYNTKPVASHLHYLDEDPPLQILVGGEVHTMQIIVDDSDKSVTIRSTRYSDDDFDIASIVPVDFEEFCRSADTSKLPPKVVASIQPNGHTGICSFGGMDEKQTNRMKNKALKILDARFKPPVNYRHEAAVESTPRATPRDLENKQKTKKKKGFFSRAGKFLRRLCCCCSVADEN